MFKSLAPRGLTRGVVIAFLVALPVVEQVHGQGRGRGGSRGEEARAASQPRPVPLDAITRPLFLETDLGIIGDHVNLDEGQELIIETLLADHADAFDEGVQALRVKIQEARQRYLEGEESQETRRLRETYEGRMQEMRDEMTRRLQDARDSEERLEIRSTFADEMRELTNTYRSESKREETVADWGSFLAEQSRLMRAWIENRRELEQEFYESSSLVLEESQVDGWSSAMQAVRRRDLPRVGVLGGESIDLSIVLEGLDLDEDTRLALRPMVNQYAASLDGPIQTRTTFLHEASPAISDTLGAGNWDRMRAIIQQEAEVRAQVRDGNLGWFESFSLVLPEEARLLFQEQVRESAFGNIWRPGRLERMLEAAVQMEGLEEGQLAAIESMDDACVASLGPWKTRVEEAYRVESPAQWIIDQQQKWAGSFNGATVDPRIDGVAGREAREGLSQAEQVCMQSLREILGDRYSSLPGARSAPRNERRSSSRSEESQRRRDELYKRFDSNGDGQLDAEERDEMRKAFQRERGRP